MTSVLSHPSAVGDRVARPRPYPMCRPDHFAVTYVINALHHLDTAVAVLDDRTIAWLPAAFTPAARSVLRAGFPDAVDLSELLLGGGGPKCCTLEVRP